MAAAVKVTTIGSSVGIDPSFAQKVDILEQVMRENRDVLKRLAA